MFLLNILKSVTLEPTMLLYYTALALSQVTVQTLLLKKACSPGYVAPLPTDPCLDEISAQKIVTGIQTWRDMIVLFGPVLFVLFAGPWSDNHGKQRKPLMWLPLCGQIVADLLNIVNVVCWNWSPTTTALMSSIPPAMTGWRSCFLIGVICYISDTTDEKSRTVHAGICSAIYFLGSPIGAILFGFLFHDIGFYGIFIICVVFNFCALGFLVFFVVEPNKPDEKEPQLKPWEGLMDPRQVVQAFRTSLKPRENRKRTILLLTILVAPITMAPLQGEYSILLLYVRYNFNWSETDYGYYAAYKCLVIFIGTVITTSLFSRLLGITDSMIGVMASVTLMAASIGYPLATRTWELFLYPAIDFMHGAGLAVVYSILSKTVEAVEFGQVNSLVGVADAMFPLINMPLYNQVYNRTFYYMPGAVFYLSLGYGLLGFIIFGMIYVIQRTQRNKEVSKAKYWKDNS